MPSNSITYRRLIYWVLALLIAFLVGLGIGHLNTTVEEKIIYEPGDTIYLTTPAPDPINIYHPTDTLAVLAYCIEHGYIKPRTDTLTTYIIDTVEVIKDWESKTEYAFTVFDIDTVGRCDISTYVQYNRLGPINTEFTPVHKVITRTKIRTIEPFVGAGLSTNLLPNVQAGMYYKNIGFSAQAVFGNDGAYAVGNILVKF